MKRFSALFAKAAPPRRAAPPTWLDQLDDAAGELLDRLADLLRPPQPVPIPVRPSAKRPRSGQSD